jgi:hypothetical protein
LIRRAASMGMRLALALLAAAMLAGCGTAGERRENWAYNGADAALQSPPRMPIGDASSEAWKTEVQKKMDAWLKLRWAAVDADKESCARKTGGSGTPGLWTGYSGDFMACMKTRGWTLTSNPL